MFREGEGVRGGYILVICLYVVLIMLERVLFFGLSGRG